LKLTRPTNDRRREASRGNHDALAHRSGIPPLAGVGVGAFWFRLAAVLALRWALAVLLRWILFHGRVTERVVVEANTGRQLSAGAGFFTHALSDGESVEMILSRDILSRVGRVPMPLAVLENTCSQLFFMGERILENSY
jgi:hypothetical protein